MLKEGNYIYKLIEKLSGELGFADFGVAKISELPNSVQQNYLTMLQAGNFANMQYLNKNLEKRFNPALLVDGAKSIIVFLAPYSIENKYLNPQIKIAQYAYGEDYHKVIKDKLFKIMEALKQHNPSFIGRSFTDSAPILEREWAVRSGLGFIGKNNFLISKKVGIKNLIGVIIINLDLPSSVDLYPDKLSTTNGKTYCGNCTKCIDACKSRALKPYNLNAAKCISYLTIENKDLSTQVASNTHFPDFNNWCYGCDECLNACPWNKKNLPGWQEFQTNKEIFLKSDAQWWNNLQDNQFNELFKTSPLLRGGLNNIKSAIKLQNKDNNGEF